MEHVILWKWLENVLDWLKELLLWWPRKMWQLLLDGLAQLIEAIPAPDFMSNLSSWISGLDPAIGYFAAPLQISTGITFVVVAMALRFAIRRIPLIG